MSLKELLEVRKRKLLYYLAQKQLSSPVKTGKLPLVICCVFKNEAPFLKEWIEFHLKQGFEKFYLINNRSDDNYKEVLKPFIEQGKVHLSNTRGARMDAFIQSREFNRALKMIKKEHGSDCWAAFLDVDEYLFSTEDRSIQDVLLQFTGKPTAAVVVNWLMFGTGGNKELNPEQPMIAQLTRRAPIEHNEHYLFKPLAYLGNIYCFFHGPHLPFEKKGALFFYSDGTQFVMKNKQLKHSPLRINHYWYRSENYYYRQKIGKRQAFGYSREKEKEDWHMQFCNEVEDREILKAVANASD